MLPDAGSKPAWRHRPKGEQTSGTQFSHSHPWDKPAEPPGQTDLCPTKKLNNKQGTEKEHIAEGTGCSEHTEGGGAKS
jgi:hypothetical protein